MCPQYTQCVPQVQPGPVFHAEGFSIQYEVPVETAVQLHKPSPVSYNKGQQPDHLKLYFHAIWISKRKPVDIKLQKELQVPPIRILLGCLYMEQQTQLISISPCRGHYLNSPGTWTFTESRSPQSAAMSVFPNPMTRGITSMNRLMFIKQQWNTLAMLKVTV